ncbi:MAG: hypothetical protein ABIJ92_04320 [Candidatus Aenigmatarchaeota archaeon]
MDTKYIMAIVFVSVLALGIASTQAVSSEDYEPLIQKLNDMKRGFGFANSVNTEHIEIVKTNVADKLEEFKTEATASIPSSYEATVDKMEAPSTGSSDTTGETMPYYTGPHRFILWTHDGENVIWGTYANGYFVGEDNNGVKVWGIYENHKFAGFYEDELFFGWYSGNHWKAMDIYGDYSYGEYKVFPRIAVCGDCGIGPGFPEEWNTPQPKPNKPIEVPIGPFGPGLYW